MKDINPRIIKQRIIHFDINIPSGLDSDIQLCIECRSKIKEPKKSGEKKHTFKYRAEY